MDEINWVELRMKKSKTKEEQVLLKSRKTLAHISEILVSNSKFHISDSKALEQIRDYLNDVLDLF